MTIYILMEDTKYGRSMEAFKTRQGAEKRLEEIMFEYPENMRSLEALADGDIYLSIDECSLEE